MSVKELKRFFNEAKVNSEFSRFLKEKTSGEIFSESQINDLVEKEIIPFALKHNFNVTKLDFEKFAEMQESGPLKLEIDDLENVAGGRSLFVKSAFSVFLCLTELVNFAPTSTVHAMDGASSIYSQEPSKQEDNEKIFEISDIEDENCNFEEIHKLRISGRGSAKLNIENFPNLNTVIISSDFAPSYDPLFSFLAMCPNVKNIEVENNNPKYTFEDGILYYKSEDSKNKVWISDDVKEISVFPGEQLIINSKRSYKNLQKITINKDVYLEFRPLRSFIEKNQNVQITFENGNENFETKEDGKIYYLPLGLPVDFKFEEIENLDLFSEPYLDTQEFSNLKSITIHPGYKDDPTTLLNLLKNNPSIEIKFSGENESYTQKDGILFYKGIPLWGNLDKIEEINLDDNVGWVVNKEIKNLKTINISTNYSEEPMNLMSIIHNNPTAKVNLVDTDGHKVNETEFYQYDKNGILYYKKSGLPVCGDFNKIKELTLNSNTNYNYFNFLQRENISFNNLETILISKDFTGDQLYLLKSCLDCMPNIKKIEVDEENSDLFSNEGILKNKKTGETEWDLNTANGKYNDNKRLIDFLPKTYSECKPYLEIRKPGKYKNPEEEYKNISDEVRLEISKQVIKILNELVKDESLKVKENIDSMNADEAEKALEKLNEQLKNRTDKAHAIYNWIAENLSYNTFDSLNENDFLKEHGYLPHRNHPAQVFKNKYGVCRGFARLANVMLRLANVPSINVGSHYEPSLKSAHAFNLIFVGDQEDGNWALMDAAWGSYKRVNIDFDGKIKEVSNQVGEINESFFPAGGNVLASNKSISNENTECHHIRGFKIRKYNSDGKMVKFKIGSYGDRKTIAIKDPDDFLNNGELEIPEGIKKMEGFTLLLPINYPNEINLKSLDLRGFKIKIDPIFFNNEKLNESNVIVDENSVYQWKDGALYDDSGRILIIGNNAEKVKISKDLDHLRDKKFNNLKEIEIDINRNDGLAYDSLETFLGTNPQIEKLTLKGKMNYLEFNTLNNIKEIEITKNFSDDQLLIFLRNNTQIEKVSVEEGNPEYSYNEEEGVLYREGFPIWGTWDNVKKIDLSKDLYYVQTKEFKNLKEIVITKNFSDDGLLYFLDKNPQIDKISVEEENSAYSYNAEEGILYHKGFSIWGNLDKIKSIELSGDCTDLNYYYCLEFPNLEHILLKKDLHASTHNIRYFLSKYPRANVKVESDENSIFQFKDGVLYDNSDEILMISNNAEKIKLSKDLDYSQLKEFKNLREIVITKNFSDDKLLDFLVHNPQIEKISVEEGNSTYSYNEKEGILYHKGFPIWGKLTYLSEYLDYSQIKEFKNLKEIVIAKNFSDDKLLTFLADNPQIEKISVEEGNSTYSYNEEEGILYHKGFPIWGKLDNVKKIYLSEDLHYSQIKEFKNLKEIVIAKNFSDDVLLTFLYKNPQIKKISVEEGNSTCSYNEEEGILYHNGFPIWGNLYKIKSIELSGDCADLSYHYYLKFPNLEHIILKPDLRHNPDKIRNFLLKYNKAELQVENGENFFLDDQKILHHKGMDMPLLEDPSQFQSLSISKGINDLIWNFILFSNMKNLKTLTIEKDCDISSSTLSELLKNNKQITQINLNDNPNFSYEDDVLYSLENNQKTPIWEKSK